MGRVYSPVVVVSDLLVDGFDEFAHVVKAIGVAQFQFELRIE